MKIRIGSRGSKLALLQTNQIMEMLKQAYPQHTYEIVIVKTHGDMNQQARLDQMNTSGIFVKKIEQQLLDHQIDLAVHSMKDMPSELQEGLCLGDVMIREDSRDVLVLQHAASLSELKPHAIIATGSKRRKYQLLKLRPDLEITHIRGNIDTRLKKMKDMDLDGIVVAAAAMHRLGLKHQITQYFDEEEMIPAVTQGAIGLELRSDDEALKDMIHKLSLPLDTREIKVERAYLKAVDGGCHSPIGARCHIKENSIQLRFVYGNEEGTILEKSVLEEPLEKEHEIAEMAAAYMKQHVKEG